MNFKNLFGLLDLLAAEPVAVTAVIDAAFALLVGLGLHLDPKLAGLLDVLVIAVLAAYARSKVSPVSSAPAAPVVKPAA